MKAPKVIKLCRYDVTNDIPMQISALNGEGFGKHCVSYVNGECAHDNKICEYYVYKLCITKSAIIKGGI